MKQNLRNVSGVFEFAYFVHFAQKWLFDDNVPYLEKTIPKNSVDRSVLIRDFAGRNSHALSRDVLGFQTGNFLNNL